MASKKTVTKIVHDAMSAFFSSKVADCTNCKQLFHVPDKLLGRHKLSPLPTTISLDCLPDQFSSYFHDKVAITGINCRTSHVPASPYNHDIEFHHTPFTSFQPITTDYYTQSLPSAYLSHENLTPYLHHFFWSGYSTPNHDQYH